MSFMDRKNIISEGFFDSLKKFFTRPKLSKEEKEMLLEKNRLSAKDCRKRRKQYVDSLESKIEEYQESYKRQKKEISSLKKQIICILNSK